ncbi:ATP-dependent helicase [Pseudomonas luteola]
MMAATSEQIVISQHESGHALVAACPGSGKTTTMISLTLELLAKGIDPRQIVILTFGKSSQTDFSKRLKDRAPQDIGGLPDVRTFNSMGNLICDALVKKGLLPSAKLEDNQKRAELNALNVIRATVGPKEFKELSGDSSKIVEDFMSYVDYVKSGFLSPKEVYDLFGFAAEYRFFPKAFENFENHRKQNRIRYFTDQIYDPVMRIKDDHRLRDWLGNKKQYILVDEYQDTNMIQHELIKIIAGEKANVLAVGDVDQSIFEWRGGSPELMLHQFSKDFIQPSNYALSRTFRYGHRLALMANNLIVNNKERADTLCISARDDIDTKVSFQDYLGDCGQEVVSVIKKSVEGGCTLNDIAVLVRLYSAAAPIELELLREGINYRLEGGRSCLYSKEMKCMEFLLMLASDQYHDIEEDELIRRFDDLLKFPHLGMKNDAVERIAKGMARATKSGEKASKALLRMKVHAEQGFARHKITEHADLLGEIEDLGRNQSSPGRILDYYVTHSKLYKSLEKMAMSTMEFTERKERCEVFLRYVKSLGKSVNDALTAFMELRNKQFTMQKNADSVVLTSIHKAKGLEWKVVIMPGLEGGRFPYETEKDTPLTTIESERRLFYVGMTRAIEHLHLFAPRHKIYKQYLATGEADIKSLWGERDEPSQFIFELDPLAVNGLVSKMQSKHEINRQELNGHMLKYVDAVK